MNAFLDLRHLRDDLRYGLRPDRGAFHRVSAHRFKMVVISALAFVYARLSLRFFDLLDALFFPAAHRTPVDRPLFIIGNFRSGTTLLLHMLYDRAERMTAMKTWEIYIAPTVSQRKLFATLEMVDRAIGSPVRRRLQRLNDRYLTSVAIHPIDLWTPEEDAGILMYAWSHFFTWFLFPRREVLHESVLFDELPRRRRLAVMRFYGHLVRKHLYYHGRSGRRPVVFLSKNPAFTGSVRTLLEVFPDARFINLMREPKPTFESCMAWFSVWFGLLGERASTTPDPEHVARLMQEWYRYPAEVLPSLPERQWMGVTLQELVDQPERVLRSLADRLELGWLDDPDVFERALRKQDRNYGTMLGNFTRELLIPAAALKALRAVAHRAFVRLDPDIR